MSENWAYNLDMLAQNGILDYDAPSFVMGQTPRYVGSPANPPSPFVDVPPRAPAMTQPQFDEFKRNNQSTSCNENNDNPFTKTPMWKKVLFGALAVGGIGFAIYKRKNITNWVKNKWNNFNWQNTKQFIVDKAKICCDFIKKCWNKFTSIFKSNNTP